MSEQLVGVIGAGSFGTAVSNILAKNVNVLLYARNTETIAEIKKTRTCAGQKLSDRVEVTNNLSDLPQNCNVLFPMVPSASFREMVLNLAPHLRPYHMMIHGTKGLHLELPEKKAPDFVLNKSNLYTMSELIRKETVVVRVGCMAGPNLASELSMGHPAATVIASPFNEVISKGKSLLRSENFQVYGNADLRGVELCGILKNIIAIGSGILSGLGLGENSRGLLVSRGLVEMIYLGKALGGEISSFVGLAGIGDLVATTTSTSSRNYTLGHKIGKGASLQEALGEMEETAEGVNTIRIIKQLADSQGLKPLITETLFKILEGEMTAEQGVNYLMRYQGNIDINFL
ncbi:NAD(P)H-dependent glycerol-3-phosphate dehydrogenase [Roseivirga thermotolerans]|uniref:Glycerol-3-phosphate dehydrogenase [NAD(P)+] n=1 Tax=Roseivirga thermotolerans TaxID=1758176 RepID=A0ABQ3I7H5_9BACT|nr:NAD(P)H-dependent glycerol-3-phosphate dehydrogenase [Roseivirga thermotolerans]GHE65348.1 glycerol-3-phosphate dehydrogenase [NAD(P)+] [Roseivirga thermotolerans]